MTLSMWRGEHRTHRRFELPFNQANVIPIQLLEVFLIDEKPPLRHSLRSTTDSFPLLREA